MTLFFTTTTILLLLLSYFIVIYYGEFVYTERKAHNVKTVRFSHWFSRAHVYLKTFWWLISLWDGNNNNYCPQCNFSSSSSSWKRNSNNYRIVHRFRIAKETDSKPRTGHPANVRFARKEIQSRYERHRRSTVWRHQPGWVRFPNKGVFCFRFEGWLKKIKINVKMFSFSLFFFFIKYRPGRARLG